MSTHHVTYTLPSGEIRTTTVNYGDARHLVPGGELLVDWVETMPPQPSNVRFARRQNGSRDGRMDIRKTMKYATKTTFDGQRATVGRTVIVGHGNGVFHPAVIVEIDGDDDIRLHVAGGEHDRTGWIYQSVATAEGVYDLGADRWCWPPSA